MPVIHLALQPAGIIFRYASTLAVLSLMLFLVLALAGPASAQSPLEEVDPSSIRADDITDTQLRALRDRAEEEGLSINDALQLAIQRGLPASEAAEIRRRMNQLEREPAGRAPADSGRQRPDDGVDMEQSEEVDFLKESFLPRKHIIFGSRLFQAQQLSFAPSANLPTPRNYEVGSGDEIVIDIWGETSNLHRLEVTPEGTVNIDNLGPVYVNGLTIEQLEDRLVERLQTVYSGLRPAEGSPNTWAQVSLGRVRSIQVSIIGEVRRPGTYTVSALSNMFNALYNTGGPDSIGTYRDIRLVRDNEVISHLDIYEFLLEGKQDSNVRLMDGDVITVGPYDAQVELYGEIKREGIYEMKPGEVLSDLLRFAGGFSSQAYTGRLTVYRNTSDMRRVITVRADRMDEVTLANGDSVHVDTMIDRFENRVAIEGAVWREGDYEYYPGMSLSRLIAEADGLRPDAYRSRGIISRQKDDYTFEMVAFDVDRVMENPTMYDMPLQPEDQVTIPSLFDMREKQNVRITGAVRVPGVFDYHDEMTLEDLVLKAEGFRESASEARIEVARRISGDPAVEQRGQTLAETYLFQVSRDLRMREDDRKFVLQPFDIVFVRENPNFQVQQNVRITGEVMYPGTYTLRTRNERISDLIDRAGGITEEAYLAGGNMTRMDTDIDRVRVELDFGAEDEDLENDNGNNRPDNGAANGSTDDRVSDRDGETDSDDSDDPDDPDGERYDRMTGRERELERVLFNREDYEEIRTSRIGIDLVEILENPDSRQNLYLREGDVINIPREMQTVRVSGAVMQEVELRYIDVDGLRRYVNRAGGFTQNALENRAYVVYANGDVERQRNYFFRLVKNMPDIEPGAEIIIPAKAERRRMETGEVVAISSAVVSMAATLTLAIDRMSR